MLTAWALNHAALTKVIREGEIETEKQAGGGRGKKGGRQKRERKKGDRER